MDCLFEITLQSWLGAAKRWPSHGPTCELNRGHFHKPLPETEVCFVGFDRELSVLVYFIALVSEKPPSIIKAINEINSRPVPKPSLKRNENGK